MEEKQKPKQHRVPPLVHCRDCGRALRSWRQAPLCGPCLRGVGSDPGWTRRLRP
jgi:hypothetical protein